MYEELQETEAKQLYVIVHEMMELDEKERSGKKRMEWDKKGVQEIFKVLELYLTMENIKFCHRVGERGQGVRQEYLVILHEAYR